ncbi:CDP-alcohol phosphatidyltransferase family protein [Pleionea sp. CnH1-48]|uniref:CDP-alcohol phosphatidyltransferase family protein n=1 Tax=Pleionea sp. CnH1-48 TaxID=2954494 RepID=UPI0020983B21|nr:CDP-alcohol phosphatidyltransferase family protein [Pleionea sp. CnH1-48]MCO7223943.1 CDP-alcohol phosphatidyltransferase family protein [Pleionea sp. CnH1-48]
MTESNTSPRKSMVHKPQWLSQWEAWIGQRIAVHPNILSAIKLFVVTPLLFLSLKQVDVLPNSSELIFALFLVFCGLDYLDGIVARERDLDTHFGRIFDRLTDYPLLFIVSWQCVDSIPLWLLISKVALDSLLFIQYLLKKGTTENRIRTTLSYTALIALLFFSQGWAENVITYDLVVILLLVNITFSLVVILYNARILQSRFIADMLSLANLLCGFASMYFAAQLRFDISLLLLLVGALFDGLDGAAARKWGGTRFGVYSDDIADGVNYGVAPGVALYYAFGGVEGAIVGAFFSIFTISRLVFFTFNKSNDDPEYFRGVPSTVGGLVVLCALILFLESPLIAGALVGVAMVLMVSFDAYYRHLGRAISSRRKRYLFGLPIYSLVLILGSFIWGSKISIALLLALVLIYGLTPAAKHLKNAVVNK